MKVLHLISGGDSGGAKTHVLSLLKDLNKSITADLVCYMEGEFADEARALGINVTVFPGSFFSGLSSTEKLIRSGDYDIIHCHGSRANLVGSILKRKIKLPFISTVHSDYKLDYLGRPLARMTYGRLNAYALRRMDHRVCVSDETMDMMIDRGFAPNDMYVIFNGVDFTGEPKSRSREAGLKALGCAFPEDSVIVGIGARLDPVKNITTLIGAFASVADKNPKLRLLIAGDGPERERLEQLSYELNVSDRVFFAGWQSDMEAYYSVVDINVICSLSETFPYAATEAARAGIPTVASRVGGLPKLIIPEETGLLFEPEDVSALAAHILRLSEDEKLRRSLGNAVFEKARAEFSTESTCSTQLEIYSSVLRRYKIKRSGERSGVVICGAYGHGNAGDEAILTQLISQLRSLGEEVDITVISRRPRNTKKLHRVNAIARSSVIHARHCFNRARLFVSGGGSLIQDVTSSRSLYYYLYAMKKAKRCGCKVQMYGCGIGPLERSMSKRQAAYIINRYVDTVTLRDPQSIKVLSDIGATAPKTVLAADPVIATKPSSDAEIEKYMLQNGLDPNGKYICVNLRHWAYTNEKIPDLAAALDRIHSEMGFVPVFLPMNASEDTEPNAEVARLYGGEHISLPVIERPELAIGLMARMQAVVAMRLHALLYAAVSGTPIVGLSYDPKVSSFIDYLGGGSSLNFKSVGEDDIVKAVKAVISDGKGNGGAALKAAERANIEQARLLY